MCPLQCSKSNKHTVNELNLRYIGTHPSWSFHPKIHSAANGRKNFQYERKNKKLAANKRRAEGILAKLMILIVYREKRWTRALQQDYRQNPAKKIRISINRTRHICFSCWNSLHQNIVSHHRISWYIGRQTFPISAII